MPGRGHDSSIDGWPGRLEAALVPGGRFDRVIVLAETESTQDAARGLGPRVGDVVVAGRQTGGRGRRGRAWADTGHDGVAVSFVVEAAALDRLAIGSAVAVATAVEPLVGRVVGIKWPNDVLVDGLKLAGVLVETSGGVAVIGIGLNVGQADWPDELDGRAVSLRQLGATAGRLEVLERLLPAVDRAHDATVNDLVEHLRTRDVLEGRLATVLSGGRRWTGRVLRVEPLVGLVLEVDGRPETMPASTTTVLSIDDDPAPGGASDA